MKAFASPPKIPATINDSVAMVTIKLNGEASRFGFDSPCGLASIAVCPDSIVSFPNFSWSPPVGFWVQKMPRTYLEAVTWPVLMKVPM